MTFFKHKNRILLWAILQFSLLFGSGFAQYVHSQNDIEAQRELRRNSPGKIIPFGANAVKPAKSIAVGRNEAYKDLSPEDLIKKVFVRTGSCTSIENVKIEVYGWNDQTSSWVANGARGLAYFEKSDSDFPMESGLVLSTGDVREAEGPNNSDSAMGGGINNSSTPDQDLQAILNKQTSQRYNVTNYTVLEFDFVPTGSKMEFKYIFASEEYPEYVESIFNDVFAFLINKVGETNKQNIALLPTTATGIREVSINNVNTGYFSNNQYLGVGSKKISNPSYFIPNKGGSVGTEFDGYTVTLTAKATLIPCQKYHLKIAIGNAGDTALGSGVFLQSNSFEAGDDIIHSVNGVTDIYNAYLDCPTNQNKLIAKISDVSDQATTVQLEFSGTAVNGTDFVGTDGQALKNTYVVPAGQTKIEIPYTLTASASPGKAFNVKLFCPCSGGTTAAEKTIKFVNSATDMTAVPVSVCNSADKGKITVSMIGTSGEYEYSLDGVNWSSVSVFEDLPIGTYIVRGRDKGGCKVYTKTVAIELVKAVVGGNQAQCGNPNFTMQAAPLKENETGQWSFVGAVPAGVVIVDPTSPTTNVTGLSKGTTVTLKWTVSNGSCNTSASLTLSNSSSVDDFSTVYKTININDFSDEVITLNLNNLCNPIPTNPDWSKVSWGEGMSLEEATGIVKYNKSDLIPSIDIFRYKVNDACGNKKYYGIYVNIVSE